MLKRIGREERGAVAVIVAICLIVLMAAVALTVDVGGLMLRKRAHVTGADAAALAAAQACAAAGFGEPEAKADEFAAANIPDPATLNTSAVNIQEMTGCGTETGHVTVQYTSDQSLYFAPVIGFDSTSPVSARATASWGGTGGANPIPIVFANIGPSDPGNSCKIPEPSFIGQECYIWYGNPSSDVPSFGFIDLGNIAARDAWHTTAPKGGNDCKGYTGQNDILEALTGQGVTDLPPLNYPADSWACAYDGNAAWTSHGSEFIDYVNANQPERNFPVVDKTTYTGQNPSAYNVIGFTHLKIMAIYSGQEAAGSTQTSQQPFTAYTYSNAGISFSQTLSSGASVSFRWSGTRRQGQSQIPVSNATCSFTTNKTYGIGVTQWRDFGAGSGCVTQQHTVTTVHSVTITAPVTTSTPGVCGPVPDGLNAGNDVHCIKVKWLGVTFGNPSPGVDLGIKAVQLCDLTYNTCLDQQ